jgi:hypothetical protein
MSRFTCSFLALGTLLVGSLALDSAPLHAQATDTTPFRGGQWGVEFTAGGFNSLGLLRFATPTRAWFGELQGRLETSNSELDGSDQPQTDERDAMTLNLQLGNRWYRPLGPEVLQYFTAGAIVGTTRDERRLGNNELTDRSTRFGAFADVGAQWMITRNLSLGASYALTATVARTTGEQGTVQRTQNTTLIGLGPVSIRGVLYF